MYKIIIKKSAEKFIEKQSQNERKKLYYIISLLPQGNDIKKLRGYKNKYRLRANNYRIIYDKYDDILLIEVIAVDNRGQVYKRL